MASQLAATLAALPDDTRCSVTVGAGDLTVGALREALAQPSEGRVVTTGQAAEAFGYSGDTWRGWAEDGTIRGAYRDGGDVGTWRLPYASCEDHLTDLQTGTLNRRRKRGPWIEAEAAQA